MKSSTNKILTLNANCFIAPGLQYLTVHLLHCFNAMKRLWY